MQLLKTKFLTQPPASHNEQRFQDALEQPSELGLVVVMNRSRCFGEIKFCDGATLNRLQR